MASYYSSGIPNNYGNYTSYPVEWTTNIATNSTYTISPITIDTMRYIELINAYDELERIKRLRKAHDAIDNAWKDLMITIKFLEIDELKER